MQKFKAWLRRLGPGLVTGASDDDPAGIATYAQAGASFGFHLLWTQMLLLPFMVGVQELSARIALVTKKGIASNIRSLSPFMAFSSAVLLLFANIFNIAADLNILALTLNLALPISVPVMMAVLTCIVIILEIFLDYATYAKMLRWLSISLLSYVLVVFFLRIPWLEVGQSLIRPEFHFHYPYLYLLVACIGTTISPYLYFWQASEVIEEEEKGSLKKKITMMRGDTIVGMVFSNVIALSIMLVGALLATQLGGSVDSVSELALLLEPLAGKGALTLFIVGIVSSGLLAIPVLAGSAGYALGESLGWNVGMKKKWFQAKGFNAILAAATLFGFIINAAGFDPIDMLVGSAVLNAVVAIPSLVAIMILGNNKDLMGKLKSGWYSNIAVGFALLLLTVSVCFMAWTTIPAEAFARFF
ncbi:MAG: divalent metal cation transporter [Candidatus Magasanikbacteria bacterium]|nr:divalent metal cation transporter [Candidatus Magasanikbacteria bacterium]MCA9389590.1 divalent metal cation transporter [Candidatus Magasanikbacteria bacterium]MCA9390743.1 divalent metal cation transporter [Candidatus Magasanikbacteria bacterium]USN52270.1 MAG: divalent metal cation transporter [Candidatus Nomurabacteria bacterium]HPF95100.1 divalent metal cation transporter [bacterium]